MNKILRLASRVSLSFVMAFSWLLLLPMPASASGESVTGGTNVSGLADNYIAIPNLEVSGDPEDPLPITLSVPRGQLSMTTTTGLTFSTAETGKTIAFTGGISDINAALDTLRYRTTRAETVQLRVELTTPGVVYFPGNGHMYEVINNGAPMTWNAAKVAAEGLTKNGATGYLATITSQDENDYLLGKLSGDGWFGASDAQTEDDWKWVTGPEAGTSFWQGLGDGNPVGGYFSNWADGEPNNAGNEDCAQFYSSGSGWNDLPCDSPALSYYVVEYGTDGQLPTAPISTTYNITTVLPTGDNVAISSCLDLIDVADESSDARYDNLSLTANINCAGETIAPMFSEVDPDLGPFGFRGTFDGNGHTISNLTIEDDESESVGLISATDGATIRDITFAGSVVSGNGCTGGLVGYAYNTAFDTVGTNVTITGYNDRNGGTVGCLDADDGASSIVDSTSAGTIEGGYFSGGMVGRINAIEAGTVSVTGNTATVTVDAQGEGAIGALVGGGEAENQGSAFTITGNTTSGITASGSNSVGGIMGELAVKDHATTSFSGNSINGDVSADGVVGGLIGYAEIMDSAQLTIANSYFAYDVSGNEGYVGGIVGEAYAEGNSSATKIVVTNSSSTGEVNGDYTVGGFFGAFGGDYGEEDTRITNSHVSGNVTGESGEVGGMIGYAYGATITQSYASGNVEAQGSAGGLIAESYRSTINKSYAEGNVTSTDSEVGGLTGRSSDESQIVESYATGNVEGSSQVGGLTGDHGNSSVILNSYARGNVTAEDNVGGLVGQCDYASIEKSYATGVVTGASDTGGLLGRDSDDCAVVDSFWDAQTTTQSESAADGTSKTTAQMKQKSTFTNLASAGLSEVWNFSSVWGMNSGSNDGYACLRWQDGVCATAQQQVQDSDGVSTAVENAAPNGGDGNDDGTPDSQQSDVASFVNPQTQKYVTLQVDGACELTAVGSQAESTDTTDGEYEYLSGLINFIADCGTPGYTTTVKQYYHGTTLAEGTVLRKYNPVTKQYFTVEDATLETQTIAGKSVVVATYTVTDGGALDTDATANGTIVDPVGLATLSLASQSGSLAPTGVETNAIAGIAMSLIGVGGALLYRNHRLTTRARSLK